MTFQGRCKRELQNDLWGGVHLPTPSPQNPAMISGVSFISMSERSGLKKISLPGSKIQKYKFAVSTKHEIFCKASFQKMCCTTSINLEFISKTDLEI
jgi:hypothetical protein